VIASWLDCLSAPVIVAPMFGASGPQLALAACRAGLVGSVPARNARNLDELTEWLRLLRAQTGGPGNRPWALAVISHSDYLRSRHELALISEFRPDIVITALGSPGPVAHEVRRYGGVVFAEVGCIEHALKAADAGADGLVLTGRHTGQGGAQEPTSMLCERVRAFFPGPLTVAAGLSTGEQVRAAQRAGADLAYIGGRFLRDPATRMERGYHNLLGHPPPTDVAAAATLAGVPESWINETLSTQPAASIPAPRSAPAALAAPAAVLHEIAQRVVDEYQAAAAGSRIETAVDALGLAASAAARAAPSP